MLIEAVDSQEEVDGIAGGKRRERRRTITPFPLFSFSHSVENNRE